MQDKEQDCLPLFIPPSLNITKRDRVSDQFFLRDEKNNKKSDVLECIKTMQPTYTSVDIKTMQPTYTPVDPQPVCSDLKKSYIFEFPEEDSIIRPGTAVEGTYSNQSSEGNYQGNSVKNSSEYEEYISDYVGDDDISDSSLLSFSD